MKWACAILLYVACPTLQYSSTLSHKRYNFRNKGIGHKTRVLIFSTIFVWNISHDKKNWARNYQKCISVFTYSTHYSSQILMNVEFSRQIFEKYSNMKFHENPSGGSRVVSCGRTDGLDKASRPSRFSQFCERAWRPTVHYHVLKNPILNQFTAFDTVSLRYILILSFNLRTDLSRDILSPGVPTKILFEFIISFLPLTCPGHLILFHFF